MDEAITYTLLLTIVGLLLYLAHIANQLLQQQRKAEKYIVAASKIATLLLSGMALPPLLDTIAQACKTLVGGPVSTPASTAFPEMEAWAQVFAQQQSSAQQASQLHQ